MRYMRNKKNLNMPSHYEIFNYWKDKKITNNLDIIRASDEQNGILVVDDWGEPSCWGCGKLVKYLYQYKQYDKWLEQEDFKKIWNYKEIKSKFNRCHILANQFGGSTDVNNMFLLCSHCHGESPDNTNSKIFFAWILNRRKDYEMGYNFHVMTKIFYDYSAMLNLNINEFTNFCINLSNIDRKKLAKRCGSNFGYVTYSSIAGYMVDGFLEHSQKKDDLKILKGKQLSLKL